MDNLRMNIFRKLKELSEPAEFCSKCGRKTVEYKRQEGFSRKTGEPVYNSYVGCPEFVYSPYTGHYSTEMLSEE